MFKPSKALEVIDINHNDDELLLRLTIDPELRSDLLLGNEFDAKVSLPSPVSAQDLSFVELIQSLEETPECKSTCFSGFTIVCDNNTNITTPCRSTCITSYTIRCDGTTF